MDHDFSVKKLNNQELILDLFKELGDRLNYTIIDPVFKDAYYFLEDAPYSICNFKIKELPGYLFGVWNTDRMDKKYVETEYNNAELVLFTDYIECINKFKPSGAGFVTPLHREVWYTNDDKRVEEWWFYELKDKLNYMKKHKYKSYYHITRSNDGIWNEISGLQALKIFYTDAYSRWYYETKKNLENKIAAAKAVRVAKKLKATNIIITDESYDTYPGIRIDCRRKNVVDLDQLNKDDELIANIEDKLFKEATVQYWEKFIDYTSTSKDIDEDARLKQRFKNMVTHKLDEIDKLKHYKLIYKNFNLEDL